MLPRISIRGFVRPSVHWSIRHVFLKYRGNEDLRTLKQQGTHRISFIHSFIHSMYQLFIHSFIWTHCCSELVSSVGQNGFLELNSTQLESKLIVDIFNSTQLKSIVEIFESTQLKQATLIDDIVKCCNQCIIENFLKCNKQAVQITVLYNQPYHLLSRRLILVTTIHSFRLSS